MGENLKPDPTLATAIMCTAHPQSTEATLAMLPIVLASVDHVIKQSEIEKIENGAHPTIQHRRHRHLGDDNM